MIKLFGKKKPKVQYFNYDSYGEELDLNLMSDSVIIKVENGLGNLKTTETQIDGEKGLSLELNGTKVLLAESDVNADETTVKSIEDYVNLINPERIVTKLDDYRMIMNEEDATFDEILKVNEEIFGMMASGFYKISLKTIFPTYGEKELFSSEIKNKELKASADTYYSSVEGDAIFADKRLAYMLPTQNEETISDKCLESYRNKSYLGRGLIMSFTGFLGGLLDGHHKATVAYERGIPIECLTIEALTDQRALRLKASQLKLLGIKQQAFPTPQSIPTIDEYAQINSFINDLGLTSHREVGLLYRRILNGEQLLSSSEFDALISYCHLYYKKALVELYPIALELQYKNSRKKYFSYVTQLNNESSVDQILYDYLKKDQRSCPETTKECEGYFGRKLKVNNSYDLNSTLEKTNQQESAFSSRTMLPLLALLKMDEAK